MKTAISHTLAALIGAIVVGVMWVFFGPGVTDVEINRSDQVDRNSLVELDGIEKKPSQPDDRQSEVFDFLKDKPLSRAAADVWLRGIPRNSLFADRFAAAGMLLVDIDLIRTSLEQEPENPFALYAAANLSGLEPEEQKEFRQRFFEVDSSNALAGYLYAQSLAQSGQMDEAISVLNETSHRTGFENYAQHFMLNAQDVFLAVGNSYSEARALSAAQVVVPYANDMRELGDSLIWQALTLSEEDSVEVRALVSSMGERLSGIGLGRYAVEYLSGISIERAGLEGLPEDYPSPYDGLSVAQARRSIDDEYDRVVRVLRETRPLIDAVNTDPDLWSRYAERINLCGEVNAIDWLKAELDDE
ncbi:MAG: hypothetical protein HRU10_04930 [Opitutales bacterium]|nr:hypothetical protein [Opitutales bacterium]